MPLVYDELEQPLAIDPSDLVPPVEPGTRIGAYTVIDEIGRGFGAAVAFLVIEPATTRAAFRSSSAKTQS